MCWVSFKPWKQEVATRDIECFKICKLIDNKIYSFYKKFEYQLNTKYKEKLIFSQRIAEKLTGNGQLIYYEINEGFHSYSNKCKIEVSLESSIVRFINVVNITGNICNLNECISLNKYPNTILLKCIIPKDSIYYINEYNEIASNYIKPIKIEKICVM